MKQETFYFKDDGAIPNSRHPLVVYRKAFTGTGSEAADWLEKMFESNNWSNTWRWGVYPYHHYHSNTHEVLGVFSGNALLQLGGEEGERLEVNAGDVIIIPAGVAHKNLGASDDFTVLGAYPNGTEPDLNKGLPGERPGADQNISAVPIPATDPLLGANGGLLELWK